MYIPKNWYTRNRFTQQAPCTSDVLQVSFTKEFYTKYLLHRQLSHQNAVFYIKKFLPQQKHNNHQITLKYENVLPINLQYLRDLNKCQSFSSTCNKNLYDTTTPEFIVTHGNSIESQFMHGWKHILVAWPLPSVLIQGQASTVSHKVFQFVTLQPYDHFCCPGLLIF